MSGSRSRNKGSNGERELIRIINDALGVNVKRNLEQTRSGGSDLKGLDGWSIEVKRQEKISINQWWEQANRQAEKERNKPVLIYRKNRKPWRCIIDGNAINPVIFPIRGIHLISMGLPEWLQIARELMP